MFLLGSQKTSDQFHMDRNCSTAFRLLTTERFRSKSAIYKAVVIA